LKFSVIVELICFVLDEIFGDGLLLIFGNLKITIEKNRRKSPKKM